MQQGFLTARSSPPEFQYGSVCRSTASTRLQCVGMSTLTCGQKLQLTVQANSGSPSARTPWAAEYMLFVAAFPDSAAPPNGTLCQGAGCRRVRLRGSANESRDLRCAGFSRSAKRSSRDGEKRPGSRFPRAKNRRKGSRRPVRTPGLPAKPRRGCGTSGAIRLNFRAAAGAGGTRKRKCHSPARR